MKYFLNNFAGCQCRKRVLKISRKTSSHLSLVTCQYVNIGGLFGWKFASLYIVSNLTEERTNYKFFIPVFFLVHFIELSVNCDLLKYESGALKDVKKNFDKNEEFTKAIAKFSPTNFNQKSFYWLFWQFYVFLQIKLYNVIGMIFFCFPLWYVGNLSKKGYSQGNNT